jgi:hypothetical protein
MKLETSVYTDRVWYQRRPGGKEGVHNLLMDQLYELADLRGLTILPETLEFSSVLDKSRCCADNLKVTASVGYISERDEETN